MVCSDAEDELGGGHGMQSGRGCDGGICDVVGLAGLSRRLVSVVLIFIGSLLFLCIVGRRLRGREC